MWRESDSYTGKLILKVGTLDDPSILDNFNPKVELFTAHRPKWVGTQEGAAQK
jgi:predicted transglutaminase-like cysteine proteinase